jgi:hypothetical protein
MKKCFFILLAATFQLYVAAQGNSGNSKGKSKNNPSVSQSGNDVNSGDKGKGKDKEKSNKDKSDKNKEDKAKKGEHDRKIWDGVEGSGSCGKPSKNQPAKVRNAFNRDYPNATNVYWTKCRGDWTGTFNGGLVRSTAVYHANGDRRDTRTPVNQDNIPGKVLDEIFKKRPVGSRIDDAIKIEVPNAVKDIFRIKNVLEGKTQFDYFDADGMKVEYNY